MAKIKKITRRRMIMMTAAAGSTALLSGLAKAENLRPLVWRGAALGAQAQLIFYHKDKEAAQDILEQCLAEITRLEQIFSLYLESSQIRRLNRKGRLENPAFELLELVMLSQEISRATKGAFDITVQPLWQFYANHFAHTAKAPDRQDIKRLHQSINYKMIGVGHQKIFFKRPNMAITLNGIAQGYITDQVTKLLRKQGWNNILINLGEIYALGRKGAEHEKGRPWQAAITDPSSPKNSFKMLELENKALATSGSYGTLFSSNGRYHHLFDPHTGKNSQNYLSVSVIAKDAVTADALSTGFSALSLPEIEHSLRQFGDCKVIIVKNDRQVIELSNTA